MQSLVERPDVVYATHDGVDLHLDLYLPGTTGSAARPCILLLHGGGMQSGNRQVYHSWAKYYAQLGYVCATIDYRLIGDIQPAYPWNIYDVKAAIQYMRYHAAEFSIDPNRLALMGSSAGAYLSAMAVLTRDLPEFAQPYDDGPQSAESASVETAIVICGSYDNIAAWEHDQLSRPLDHIKEKYLGGSPMTQRRVYYESSPLFHVDAANVAGTKWLVVWGTHDDVADPDRQAKVFLEHLKRAGATARACPVPGATHFWYTESDVDEPGRFASFLAPRARSFLQRWVGWRDVAPMTDELSQSAAAVPSVDS